MQAIRVPILLARGVRISSLHRGVIQFTEKCPTGGTKFGFQDSEASGNRQTVLNIRGTLVLKGKEIILLHLDYRLILLPMLLLS